MELKLPPFPYKLSLCFSLKGRHTYWLLKKFSREHTLYTSYYWYENDHTLMSITSCYFKESKACQSEGGTIVQDLRRNLYDIKASGCKVTLFIQDNTYGSPFLIELFLFLFK